MNPSDVATRPAYRPYRARVARRRQLAPHFVRLTFTGSDFAHFGTAGHDQRVKVVLPASDGTLSDIGQDDPEIIDAGTWHQVWRALPEAQRTPFRTYTVRRIDPLRAELDLDFVLHHEPGPAGAWAERARIGDEVVIVGPDARSPHSHIGLDWHPGPARRLLLAGDETAAPAIGAILESLRGRPVLADAFIEVPTDEDTLPITNADHLRVRWLPRGAREHGAALIDAVDEWARAHGDVLAAAAAPAPQRLDDIDVDRDLLWDSPAESDGEFYAWIAGESATVKTLRRRLVQGAGVDRRRVAFMGYWRRGRSERQE